MREEKHVWVKICPRCLSLKIKKLGALSGDMTGSIGLLPWKYECCECGWVGRFVLEKETFVSKDVSRSS